MAMPYVNHCFSFAMKPPDKLTVDAWAERNIYLPPHTSSEPGLIRIARTPYTRGVLRAFGALNIEHIVLVSGRQVGKSQGILYPCLAYAIVQDPGPALFVISTKELAKYTSNNRLQPMFLQCEAVKEKLTSDPDDFTTSEMRFQNMILSIVGGGSISQMISRPVRYLFRDEIDEITGNVAASADPLKAVEETTSTFASRKIVDTSTPTTTDGNIWQLLGNCQYVFEYFVPCPLCGEYQIMLWDRIKFDSEEKDREKIPAMTYYECKSCKEALYEIQKADMVKKGKWQARLTEHPTKDIMDYKDADIEDTVALEDVLDNYEVRKIGFHLPKWYGLFFNTTWGIAAKEYLEAVDANREYGDYIKLQTWMQYWAAKPWVERAESKAVTDIMNNKTQLSSFIAPAGTVALTCGVDMAQDGFWFVVVAWRRDMSCHLLHYGFIAGWESLTSLLWETSYPVEGSESRMGIYRLGIDTGGTKYQGDTAITMTEACYEWLRRHARGRAFGLKGSSHAIKSGRKMQASVIDKMPSGKPLLGGLMNWIIDTEAFKDVIHYRLNIQEGNSGRFTLSADTEVDYIKHLLSEEKRLNRKTGKYEWVKVSQLNHLLDATVYAFAVADSECSGGVRIARPIRVADKVATAEAGQQRRVVKKSNWVSSWKM